MESKVNHFQNLYELEHLLRCRLEANFKIFAEKLKFDALDMAVILCEIHDESIDNWMSLLAKKIGKSYEDTLTSLLDLWLLVGDEKTSSPLIAVVIR